MDEHIDDLEHEDRRKDYLENFAADELIEDWENSWEDMYESTL